VVQAQPIGPPDAVSDETFEIFADLRSHEKNVF